jgi:hypothetical protein
MWEMVRKTLGAVVISAAIAGNIGVVLSTAAGAAAKRKRGTDVPLGAVAALVLYTAEGSSAVTAIWFCMRLGGKAPPIVRDVWDRLLWVGLAMVFVPLTTFFAGGLGLILGPPGWVVGGLLGGAAPYLVLDRLL